MPVTLSEFLNAFWQASAPQQGEGKEEGKEEGRGERRRYVGRDGDKREALLAEPQSGSPFGERKGGGRGQKERAVRWRGGIWEVDGAWVEERDGSRRVEPVSE